MEKPELEPKELPIQADSDFKFSQPYGMSTWIDGTGILHLFHVTFNIDCLTRNTDLYWFRSLVLLVKFPS